MWIININRRAKLHSFLHSLSSYGHVSLTIWERIAIAQYTSYLWSRALFWCVNWKNARTQKNRKREEKKLEQDCCYCSVVWLWFPTQSSLIMQVERKHFNIQRPHYAPHAHTLKSLISRSLVQNFKWQKFKTICSPQMCNDLADLFVIGSLSLQFANSLDQYTQYRRTIERSHKITSIKHTFVHIPNEWNQFRTNSKLNLLSGSSKFSDDNKFYRLH